MLKYERKIRKSYFT